LTSCPDCGLDELESLGIEKGERQDDEHCLLVSKFKCRNCGCQFTEAQHTQWKTETTKHGNLGKLLTVEVTPQGRKKLQNELESLEQVLSRILQACEGDWELLAVFEFKLREHMTVLRTLRGREE